MYFCCIRSSISALLQLICLKSITDNSRNDATGTLSNLSSLFHTGQLVVCCVLSVQKSHVELSINPKHVNSNVTAKTIVPNMVSTYFIVHVHPQYSVFASMENLIPKSLQLN